MITIVRFTNTKTIYTVVTDCHSRVIASILVNPAPCMNPHHLLRWLMRRLACGTFRSDLPLLPEGDKMCLNKDEVRPILARARVVHVHPRPPPVAPGADHVLEPDVQISMIMILMIRIFESKKLWGRIAPITTIFWPTFHLFLLHLSNSTWSSCHRRHDQSSGRQDEVDLPSTHRRRRLLRLGDGCQYSIPQMKRKKQQSSSLWFLIEYMTQLQLFQSVVLEC